MKLILITALMLVGSISMAQSTFKMISEPAKKSHGGNVTLQSTLAQVCNSWIIIGDSIAKPLLSFDKYPKYDNKPIESVIIHVKRSKTVWLNDSTLIVKP
ncbi:hypothetical protein [Mucilaginibacter sp. 10I4]|uniref:hypothetical protein n=1 Tax=Mucilaginibacter sp. 10I4 TaxID=3048580 RepID=UPI002B235278|nr:hypothetical protein [Mucilaginibacter sp. 10I4]MEB0262892.1 hypothetical protein [Mucilaginibacter sp. 10I4]